MTTFEMPKNIDEIQEAVLLEPEWYLVRLVQEPGLEDNKKKKDGASPEDGAGQNIVLRFRVQDENPSLHGRQLTKWLSWPSENDEGKFTNSGQPMVDWKMENIVLWASVLGGEAAGASATFEVGSECYVPVIQEEYQGNLSNSIDMNTAPKPV